MIARMAFMLELTKNNERWIEYKGQQVGFVISYNHVEDRKENVYVTERTQYFKFKGRDGFSISKAVLNILTINDITSIRIVFKQGLAVIAVYITTLDKWLKEGETNFFKITDEQLFIPLDKFDKTGE